MLPGGIRVLGIYFSDQQSNEQVPNYTTLQFRIVGINQFQSVFANLAMPSFLTSMYIPSQQYT
jgi:hypothetical protein